MEIKIYSIDDDFKSVSEDGEIIPRDMINNCSFKDWYEKGWADVIPLYLKLYSDKRHPESIKERQKNEHEINFLSEKLIDDIVRRRSCFHMPKRELVDESFLKVFCSNLKDITDYSFSLVVYHVPNLECGVYEVQRSGSIKIKNSMNSSMLRMKMQHAMIGHDIPLSASFTLIVHANIGSISDGSESIVFEHFIDVGSIIQKQIILCEQANLLTHITPAFRDSYISHLLKLPEESICMHSLSVG